MRFLQSLLTSLLAISLLPAKALLQGLAILVSFPFRYALGFYSVLSKDYFSSNIKWMIILSLPLHFLFFLSIEIIGACLATIMTVTLMAIAGPILSWNQGMSGFWELWNSIKIIPIFNLGLFHSKINSFIDNFVREHLPHLLPANPVPEADNSFFHDVYEEKEHPDERPRPASYNWFISNNNAERKPQFHDEKYDEIPNI